MNTTKKLNKKNNVKSTKPTMKNAMEKRKYMELSENPLAFLKTKSHAQIATLLRDASSKYYEGNPVITDDIFDIVKDYLTKEDSSNPVLAEIGAPVGSKVKLPYWMGSLDKIRDDEKALDKWKAKHKGNVLISDKLDGNSALLVFSNGKAKMYSRGDGFEGQDISHLIPLIQGVPKESKVNAIRGELIISRSNWETVKHKGANPRNSVAGVMHSKNPDKELAAVVEFVAYEQLDPRVTISKGLNALKANGFKVVHYETLSVEDLSMDSLSAILMARRKDSPYEVDGIVVFHDDEHNQVSGKNPSYAFGFKSLLTHEEAEVIVKEVEWTASKDGYLKPLLHFDPVTLAGASIQKATGFNGKYIEQHKIGPGSRIVIIRSGDVIPHVVRILSPSATGKPSLPSVEYEWNETHVDIVLKDKKSNEGVAVKNMTYFAATLGMKGVGEGVVERLYKNGITTIKKLLHVTAEELINMEGFQKKSAEKVVAEIAAALQRADCLTYMDASNLFGRSIGTKKLKLILSKFPKVYNGYVPSLDELSTIDGIGTITGKQFLEGLPHFFAFMKDIGIPCDGGQEEKAKPLEKGKALDITVVFTGVRNKELEAEIEARGGKVATSVSKKTTVVVAKDPSETSSKITTAKELGVPVVSLEDFKKDYM